MSDAVDLMLGVFRAPERSALLRTRELPDGVLDVIRIAAGDEQAIAAARASTALDHADLCTAAGLLLRNLFFFDGADSYRTLGVRSDADPAQIKRHYRWLVRWLHPDRNPDSMHGFFVDRINCAWNSIRTPERRSSYDLSLQATPDAGGALKVVNTATLLRKWTERSPMPLLSARAVRRLPQIILFCTGLIAVTALCLVAWILSLNTDPAQLPSPTSSTHLAASVEPPAKSLPTVLFTSSTVPPSAAPPAGVSPSPVAVSPLQLSGAEPAPMPAAMPLAAVAEPAPPKPVATVSFGSAVPARPTSARATTAQPDSPPGVTPAREANASASATTPGPAVTQARTGLSDGDLRDFVDRFQHLYGADDVERFLALFSAQAQGNNRDYAGLASDYRRLFEQRRRRRLNLSELHWEIDGEHAAGNGNYEAWVGPSADKPQSRTRGQIMLQLTREDGGVRITRLHHTVTEL